MYGWRARCGVILPVDNTVMEPELYALNLSGVSFHAARLTTTERDRMPEEGMRIAPLFVEMGVDAIVYACAETSFLGGVDANEVIIARLIEQTGLPSTTATWAMVLALRSISAKRIALVTPYAERRGQVMEEFLGRSGVEVVVSQHRDFHVGSADPREWYETNMQPPSTAYRMVRDLDISNVDAVLISATNFRTLDVIEQLERDLGIPVVSCNQAILWWLARELKLEGVRPLGRLGHA